VVGLSSLFVIGIVGIFLVVAFAETKGDLFAIIEQELKTAISAAVEQFWGSSPESQEFESKLAETVPLMMKTMPGMLVSCTLGLAWINLLISRRYCRIDSVELCAFEKLTLWKTPEFIVWFAIAGGVMALLPVSGLKMPGINLLIVMGTIYFFQGLAIMAFYFERWKLPLLVKGFVYALLFLQQFASVATAALGLFDIWFDFRKLARKQA